jgi:hypothetical protein
LKLKWYYHLDADSNCDDVNDSVHLSFFLYSDSDTYISTDGDSVSVTSTYTQYSDSDTKISLNFYSHQDSQEDAFSPDSDLDSIATTNTTTTSLGSSVSGKGSTYTDINEASITTQNDLKVTYTVAELLPVAKNQSKPGFTRRFTWNHHSNKSR